MGRRTVAQFANRIKRVLSPTRVNNPGRRIGFCYRERLMTPYRLVLSLLARHAMGPVETLADTTETASDEVNTVVLKVVAADEIEHLTGAWGQRTRNEDAVVASNGRGSAGKNPDIATQQF